MKTNIGNSKQPLPGDRQGMSGADAGHDSMRDVGDKVLKRRALVPKQTTAQTNNEVDKTTETVSSNPGTSQDSADISRKSTKGTRIKWTKEMNCLVIKMFLQINECRDDPLPGWRQKLHTEMNKTFPHLKLTQQNVSDRLRAIYSKKLLAQQEIDQIRREVGHILTQIQTNLEIREDTSIDFTHSYHRDTPVAIREVTEPVSTTERETYELFQFNYSLFHSTDPLSRPLIPQLNFKKNTTKILNDVKFIFQNHIKDIDEIEQFHLALYAAAVTTIELNCQQVMEKNKSHKQQLQKEPAWKVRLTKTIDDLRRQISTITEYLNGNTSNRIARKLKIILKHTHINPEEHEKTRKLIVVRDELSQKCKAKGARLRRYNKATRRKEDNFQYSKCPKKFYQKLENPTDDRRMDIEMDSSQFFSFWRDTWATPSNFKTDTEWMNVVENSTHDINAMPQIQFTKDDIAICLKSLRNWRAPGPDGIQNFWLKTFGGNGEAIARCFNKIIENPSALPTFLASGNTFLFYKKGDRSKPENYRPITCLSSVYKLLTAAITCKIYDHCTLNNIIASEQKGCIKNSLGSKEQLTIDAILIKHAQVKRRNINMSYIDYSKAFDSVPHDWLIKVLDIYKIHPSIKMLLNTAMKKWNTQLFANNTNLGQIDIKKGIFQGDSLSPLWFVLSLNPLSLLLNSTTHGYRPNPKENNKISHLMFMDDIKLYAETPAHLHQLIDTTKTFSNDIQMNFGMEKCATIYINKGKWQNENLPISEIKPLSQTDTYKYLGVAQNRSIDHTTLKKEFKEKYRSRLTKLLNTYLNSRNLISAVNSWAVSTLTYSFGILKYSDADLDELDRLTRRLLKKFRCHHPQSALERLYLKRKEGGRGLLNIKSLCRSQEQSMKAYFIKSNSNLHKLIVTADNKYTPLNLSTDNGYIQQKKTTMVDAQHSWRQKILHGKFPASLDDPNIDKENSLTWLRKGVLHPETEGFVISIQDRVIRTRNYEKHILNKNVQDTCRKCGAANETIDHVIAGCPCLSDTAYLARHNQIAKIIHKEMALKYRLIEHPPPYYRYSPEPVLESAHLVLYWDRPIITDRTIDYNRPDLVLIDKDNKKALIIDIACPLTHNLHKTEVEKIRKYENLAVELKHVWQLSTVEIIPIVISACGVMTTNLRKNIDRLGLCKELSSLMQKSVLLQTCAITRKFLNV